MVSPIRSSKATPRTEKTKEIAEDVRVLGALAANGEARVERQGVADFDGAENAQERSHIHAKSKYYTVLSAYVFLFYLTSAGHHWNAYLD